MIETHVRNEMMKMYLGQAYHWIPIIQVADGISIVCAIMIWL